MRACTCTSSLEANVRHTELTLLGRGLTSFTGWLLGYERGYLWVFGLYGLPRVLKTTGVQVGFCLSAGVLGFDVLGY